MKRRICWKIIWSRPTPTTKKTLQDLARRTHELLHINSTKIRYRFLIETDKIVYRYQCIVRVSSCIGVHLVAVLLLLEEAIMTCVWIMTTICGESLGDETDKIILSAYTPSICLLPTTGNTTLKQLFSVLFVFPCLKL